MRVILLLLIISKLTFAQSDTLAGRKPLGDGWWQLDKLKHFSTSFYLTTTGYYFQNRCAELTDFKAGKNAALVSFSFGLTKEILDWRRPNGLFSWRDLACDLCGITAALLFIRVAT